MFCCPCFLFLKHIAKYTLCSCSVQICKSCFIIEKMSSKILTFQERQIRSKHCKCLQPLKLSVLCLWYITILYIYFFVSILWNSEHWQTMMNCFILLFNWNSRYKHVEISLFAMILWCSLSQYLLVSFFDLPYMGLVGETYFIHYI